MLKKNNCIDQLLEILYLSWRYIKAYSYKLLFYIIGILPNKDNRIVVIARKGGLGYGCNPKALVNEMIEREKKAQTQLYDIIWLVNDETKEFPKEVKKVKNTLLNRVYYLSTATIWIDDDRKEIGTRKKKNQLYIQTWHGMIGFKAVGALRGNKLPYIAKVTSVNDSKMADYFLSNSEWCTQVYRDGFFYEGTILKSGSPRCDILFRQREETYLRIRREFNLSDDVKILMYAPTYRGGTQNKVWKFSVAENNINFNDVIKTMEKRFGGKWIIFLRLHQYLANQYKEYPLSSKDNRIIDVTQKDDMYELLAATDAFISDYSSAAFDASYMKIPVFIYAEDLNEYTANRGILWEKEEIPFPFADSTKGLCEKIEQFNSEEYIKRIDRFFENEGVLEDGRASIRVVDTIDLFLKTREKIGGM